MRRGERCEAGLAVKYALATEESVERGGLLGLPARVEQLGGVGAEMVEKRPWRRGRRACRAFEEEIGQIRDPERVKAAEQSPEVVEARVGAERRDHAQRLAPKPLDHAH